MVGLKLWLTRNSRCKHEKTRWKSAIVAAAGTSHSPMTSVATIRTGCFEHVLSRDITYTIGQQLRFKPFQHVRSWPEHEERKAAGDGRSHRQRQSREQARRAKQRRDAGLEDKVGERRDEDDVPCGLWRQPFLVRELGRR